MIYICPRASNCLLKIVKQLEKFERVTIYFPANICYTFPLSVIYSEAKIKFYDIDFETLYPDFKTVEKDDNFLIFVCVIPYGDWDKEEVEKIREKIRMFWQDKVFILWDCALTFPTYEVLDYVLVNIKESEGFVFSFSYAKPLELGFGAALFTKMKIEHKFPFCISKDESSFLVNRVDKIFKTYLNLQKVSLKNQSFLCYNSELHKNDINYIDKIVEKILNKEDFEVTLRNGQKLTFFEIMEKKKANNKYFRENIGLSTKSKIKILSKSDLCWRFNIRVDEGVRDRIIERIFLNGAFASRLFPNLTRYLKTSSKFPNTSKHWKHVINIFNNQNEDYNKKIIKSIEEMKEIL